VKEVEIVERTDWKSKRYRKIRWTVAAILAAAAFFLVVEGITIIAVKQARCQGSYCAGIYCVSDQGCALGCDCIANSCQ